MEVTSANVLEELKQNNSASSSPALSHGFVKKKIAGPGKGPRQLNKKNEQ